MQKECFMLVDDQNRKFFVTARPKKIIQDFVQNYDLQIYSVKTNKEYIKSVEEIVVMFCDQNYNGSNIEYKIINAESFKKTKTDEIRKKIEDRFVERKKTTFAEIQKIFKKDNISISSLNNYFAQVRKHLSIKGVCVQKIKNGTYIIKD